MVNRDLEEKAKCLLDICIGKQVTLSVAESCTGGMISALLTDIPGSSQVFDRGFVTYSNAAKVSMLGVFENTIDKYGAVSHQVALEMAEGACLRSAANLSVSVTGIAGPGGATEAKPIGLVYIASALMNGDVVCNKYIFTGDRREIRRQSVESAIDIMISRIS